MLFSYICVNTNNMAESKGLGDTVEKVIDKVLNDKVINRKAKRRLKNCSSCKRRKETLNKIMPYKTK